MKFSVKRNLTALYLVKIAKWMNLVMPIIVLFYKSNGLTMQDIFLLQSAYSLTLMTLEIPTGYFADKVGRKTSILIGSMLGFSGYLVYSFSFGFWQFVIAEVILGVSQSLVSGADSALLYDTLKAAKQNDKYIRLEGRITSIGNFGEAFAGIIGGLLAVSSLRTPFYVQTCVALIALPAALMLMEPPIKSMQTKPGFRDVLSIMSNVLHGNLKLKWNTFFSAITGAATLTMAWFAQPYFGQIKLPVSMYGVVWALLNLCVGIAAVFAWRIEKKNGTSPDCNPIYIDDFSFFRYINLGSLANRTAGAYYILHCQGIGYPYFAQLYQYYYNFRSKGNSVVGTQFLDQADFCHNRASLGMGNR